MEDIKNDIKKPLNVASNTNEVNSNTIHEINMKKIYSEDPAIKNNIFIKETIKTEFKRIMNTFEDGVHPAGCIKEFKSTNAKGEVIIHKLIIEPIDSHEYVYTILGKKGIVKADFNPENKKYYLDIEGRKFTMDGKPLDTNMLKLIQMPDKDTVKAWVKGERKSLSVDELFKKMKMFFKFFTDLSDEAYYDLLVMTVFQSWFAEMLTSLWYVAITGSFGGGKSTSMEACLSLCKHGCNPGDASISFIARGLDKLKCTVFFDEFDSIAGDEDSEYYAVVRLGQRRGPPFSRMGDKGETFLFFDVFGVKLFSIHNQLEDALQSRSFIINTFESSDGNVSYAKLILDKWSNKLYTELFLWFMNEFKFFNLIDSTKVVSDIMSHYEKGGNVTAARKLLVDNIPHGNNLKYSGRDAEMEGTWMSISSLLNISDLVDPSVGKLIDLKNDIRDEMRETGINGLVRDYIVKYYRKNRANSEFFTKDGKFFQCGHKEANSGFNVYAKGKGEYNISKGAFTGALKELGFIQGKNKKKMRIFDVEDGKKHIRTGLIFDESVQKRIGLKIEPFSGGLMNNAEDLVMGGDEQ